MIQIGRLRKELQIALGVRVDVAHLPKNADESRWAGSVVSFHNRPDEKVRIDWPSAPSPAQLGLANTTVAAHDGAKIRSERMEGLHFTPIEQAAVIRFLHALWQNMSPAQKSSLSLPLWTTVNLTNARDRILGEED